MKKICFFVGNLNHSGGTERVSTSIANALAERGYEITMLNLWEGEQPFFKLDPSIMNDKLHSGRVSFAKNYISTIKKLRLYLKSHNIQTLIVVESMLVLFSLPASIRLNINHITWEHFNYNVNLGKKSRSVARHLARLFSNSIVTLTERDKEIWMKKTIGNAKILSIPNPSPYEISSHKPSLNNQVVLAIGRLTYQKGFDYLLKAWAEIKKEKNFIDWRLQIVGEGEDKDSLTALISDLKISDSVEMYPFSNNVSEFYKNSSVYCLSSRFEGLPMVLIETQSLGIPVVAFDCDTGPSEIIENGKSGLLAKIEDYNDLALKLSQMISVSEEEYSQFSSHAKKQAERFKLDSIIEYWLKLV